MSDFIKLINCWVLHKPVLNKALITLNLLISILNVSITFEFVN